ncbi:HNH endonuclease [Hyphococcus sp.]|jgi:predicted restriction endonuclease|uniref:HNH endonuclease n=1 Tax=Hyphococcus sp. TaxID=2038636 RepID=UPI003D123BF2
MAVVRRLWNREELVQALYLYCVTPFGRLHARNPEIIALAEQLGRTPNAMALKLVNFASLDPTIARKGMGNVSSLDKQVWAEFFNERLGTLAFPEERLSGFSEQHEQDFIAEFAPGLEIETRTKRRVNQGFFRRLVLASYDSKCALSGITTPELLVAGHIVPWSHNVGLRTDPRNGICLNPLFDRAFDQGLIAIDDDYTVLFSSKLHEETTAKMKSIASEKLVLPSRFQPQREHFEYHRDMLFQP